MTVLSRLFLALGLAAIACAPRVTPEATSAAGSGDYRPASEVAAEEDAALAKASSRLLEARSLAATGKSDEEIRAAVSLLELRDGRALVEVALERLTPEILERLGRAGLEVQSHSLPYARAYGWVALDRLDEVAAVPEVATIHPQAVAGTRKSPPGPVPP